MHSKGGFHFEFNINFDTGNETLIPYYKYTKSTLIKILSPIFNYQKTDLVGKPPQISSFFGKDCFKNEANPDSENEQSLPVRIQFTEMNIYALYVIENGISLLGFIPHSSGKSIVLNWLKKEIILHSYFPKYLMDIIGHFCDGMSSDTHLQNIFSSKDSSLFKVPCQQMKILFNEGKYESAKSEANVAIKCIDFCKSQRNKFWNCGFHRKSGMFMKMNSFGNYIHLVQVPVQGNNRHAWHYMFVDSDKEIGDTVTDESFVTMFSGFGKKPPQSIKDIVQHECADWYPWIIKFSETNNRRKLSQIISPVPETNK